VTIGATVAISASTGGQSGSSAVTVVAPTISTVVVSPSTATVFPGTTARLTATASDAQGQPIPAATFAWTSSNPQLATVDQTGLVTGVSVGGPVTITALSGGRTGSSAVTVLAPPTGSIEVIATTTGLDLDADGYLASVGANSRALAVNGTVRFDGVAPGVYQVALQGVAANCTVAGGNSQSVAVTVGVTTQARFDVHCALEQRIAFRSDRDGDFEIFTMRADGTDVRQLTTNNIVDTDPHWSRDGTRIVFIRAGDIWVMDADGRNPRPVLVSAQPEADPDWSPNGLRIVFASEQADGTAEIFVTNADGTGVPQQLTNSSGSNWNPHFSPNGATIVYVSDRIGTEDIFLMNANGSGDQRLTTDPASDDDPAWSPDGKQILFASNRDGDDDLWFMNADGTSQTQLTSNSLINDWSPSAAADGMIAFSTDRNGKSDIYVLSGASQFQRTNDPGNDSYPDWRIAVPASPGLGESGETQPRKAMAGVEGHSFALRSTAGFEQQVQHFEELLVRDAAGSARSRLVRDHQVQLRQNRYVLTDGAESRERAFERAGCGGAIPDPPQVAISPRSVAAMGRVQCRRRG
jgi:TolB protein